MKRSSHELEAALPHDLEAALPQDLEANLPHNLEANLPHNLETAFPSSAEASLHGHEIPHYLNRPFILSGYRMDEKTPIQCVLSIFQIHNETVGDSIRLCRFLLSKTL